MKLKIFVRVFLILGIFFFSYSCSDIKEEVWIHSSEEVTLQYQVDFSLKNPMLSSPILLNALLQSMTINGINISEKMNFNFSAQTQKMQDLLEIDTLIYLKTIPTFSRDSIYAGILKLDTAHVLSKKDRRSLTDGLTHVFQKGTFNIKTDKVSQVLSVKLRMDQMEWEKMDNVGNSFKILEKAYPDAVKLSGDFLFALEKNSFRRGNFLFPGSEKPSEKIGEEEKAMWGDTKITTIYHFPNKVKSASNSYSRILDDKRTVETVLPILDLYNGKTVENNISFQ